MSALNDMLRLLPPGIAWTRNPLSHFFKLWSAMAPEFDRVEARARDLYDSFIFERTSERSRDFWEATNNLVPVDVLGVAVEVFGLVDEDFGPLSKANIISRGPMTEARFERWLAALPERWNVLPALAFETTAPLALTIAIDSTDLLGLNYILFSIEAWKLGNVSITFEHAPAFTSVPTVTNKTNPGNPILVGDEAVVDHTVEAVPSAGAATYQWTRDGVDIAGETTQEYLTVLADAGTELAVEVTRTNSRGTRVATSESFTMDALPAAPVISGVPSIDDTTPQVGDTLTATPAGSSGNPTPTRTWQWQRASVDIPGATSVSYVVQAADETFALRVIQTETNSEGFDSETSVETAAVAAAPVLTPPVISGVPSIDDTTPQVGDSLTAAPASVTGSPSPTRTWQWQRDDIDIPGATAASYTVQHADEGAVLSVIQMETNSEGSDTAESPATSAVTAANAAPSISGVPTIDDMTPEVGDILTATAASVTGNPTPTRTWQWRRDGVDISGATSAAYEVVGDDVGAVLSVIQTETNSEGADSATSSSTSVVPETPVAPVISGTPTIDDTTPAVGDTLVVTPTESVSGVPTPTRTLQWTYGAGYIDIPGATGASYVVEAAYEGEQLAVIQTEANSEGSSFVVTAQTAAVSPAPSAPVITGIPTIDNTSPAAGDTLTATPAAVAGNPTPTRTYEWTRGPSFTPIGTNSPTYVVQPADVGEVIRVAQLEDNTEGFDDATSAETAAVVAAPGGWTPADLSPVSWFRADMGVTESGGDVSLWEDQVGSNDLEQLTALDQPTLNATGLGGEPCIDFDGVDHWLRNTAFALSATDNLTIVWIGRLITTQNGGRFINWGASPRLFEASVNLTWSGVGLDPDSQAVHGNADRCHVFQWEESGTQDIFFGESSQDPLAEGAGGIAATTSFAIGAYTNGAVPSNLRVGELVVLNRSLTAGELTSLATYSNGRYGTAI